MNEKQEKTLEKHVQRQMALEEIKTDFIEENENFCRILNYL